MVKHVLCTKSIFLLTLCKSHTQFTVELITVSDYIDMFFLVDLRENERIAEIMKQVSRVVYICTFMTERPSMCLFFPGCPTIIL
jgi:hypothetical protein